MAVCTDIDRVAVEEEEGGGGEEECEEGDEDADVEEIGLKLDSIGLREECAEFWCFGGALVVLLSFLIDFLPGLQGRMR